MRAGNDPPLYDILVSYYIWVALLVHEYKKTMILRFLIVSVLMLASAQSMAAELRVAVASNFTRAMITLANQFETDTGHKVKLVFGSTGKHYAQIRNGAPFDAFFSADMKRPKLLEEEGLAVPGSRFSYALGKLVLWSPKAGYIDPAGKVLSDGNFYHLAIANPKLAPYGRAAREVLQSRGLWNAMKGKAVRGENIGQAFQFVSSGNAELGFIAYSQIKRPGQSIIGSYWEVPQSLYTPIVQQAVLLKDNEATRAFISYVRSKPALEIIQDNGYDAP